MRRQLKPNKKKAVMRDDNASKGRVKKKYDTNKDRKSKYPSLFPDHDSDTY